MVLLSYVLVGNRLLHCMQWDGSSKRNAWFSNPLCTAEDTLRDLHSQRFWWLQQPTSQGTETTWSDMSRASSRTLEITWHEYASRRLHFVLRMSAAHSDGKLALLLATPFALLNSGQLTATTTAGDISASDSHLLWDHCRADLRLQKRTRGRGIGRTETLLLGSTPYALHTSRKKVHCWRSLRLSSFPVQHLPMR